MSTRTSFRRLAPVVLLFGLTAVRPARAVNKDMIQLQTQVQQLIDSVARMQQSNDQNMGVLKDLVQQTVDSVNKMSTTVSALQLKMQNQSDAQGQRNDQLSGQVQALNDSLDELKARMQRMEKSLTDLQGQAQSANAILGSLPGANPGAAGASPASASQPSAAPSGPPPSDNNADTGGLATRPAPVTGNGGAPAGAGGPSAGDMYRAAYTDYMAGKYPLASSEFGDLIKAHPDDNLAGNAYFYTGEIDRRADKPAAAVRNYDQVLERYPDNAKIPAAHLHKGEALLAQKQTEAGIRELRSLVQRFPNSPEASQARARLQVLGASGSARR